MTLRSYATRSGSPSPMVEAGTQPNVAVQLLPFSLGAHPGLYGLFVILAFPDPTPDLSLKAISMNNS